MKPGNLIILTVLLFALFSCKKNDVPTYDVSSVYINTEDYTMGGNVIALFSTDNFITFSSEFPDGMEQGDEFSVKLYNGNRDLTLANFYFDWSSSSLSPDDPGGSQVDFTVGDEEINISVTVSDKYTLMTSLRSTGEFFSLDEDSGEKTLLFTVMHDGEPVIGLRGLTYHKQLDRFFATQTSNEGGALYSIEPVSKMASLINANDGSDGMSIWDAVVNWTVVEPDSLIGYGDFNADGNGLVRFGTDGGRSASITRVQWIYGGLGMVFDVPNEEILFANGNNSTLGTVNIDKLSFDGTVSDICIISEFEYMPEGGADGWLPVKALASHNNILYGILFNSDLRDSYLVKVDIDNLKITYITTLGVGNSEQYNMLYSIPRHTLHVGE